MPLVDYSDSDECSENYGERSRENIAGRGLDKATEGVSTQPINLPPLPSGFHDLYASQVRASTKDDPSLHGGRRRQIPHVEGMWNTHVYIEWFPGLSDTARLESELAKYESTHSIDGLNEHHVHSLLRNDLGVALPLHISLSKPFSLVTEQLDPFFDDIKARILALRVQPFSVKTSSLAWVPNHDKSRWFLVFRLEQSQQDSLNQLLCSSNETSKLFDKPALYGESSREDRVWEALAERLAQHCHISIAWSLEAPQPDKQFLKQAGFAQYHVPVTEIKVKTGNRIQSITLPSD